MQASSGDPELSHIWTPDIELYNGYETIVQGSLKGRPASIFTCAASTRSPPHFDINEGGKQGVPIVVPNHFWSTPTSTPFVADTLTKS